MLLIAIFVQPFEAGSGRATGVSVAGDSARLNLLLQSLSGPHSSGEKFSVSRLRFTASWISRWVTTLAGWIDVLRTWRTYAHRGWSTLAVCHQVVALGG